MAVLPDHRFRLLAPVIVPALVVGLVLGVVESSFAQAPTAPQVTIRTLDTGESITELRDRALEDADAAREMAEHAREHHGDLARMLADLHVEADLSALEMGGAMMGSGFSHPREIVKNAPYQADAVTESVRVLFDGNRIVRRTVVALARDAQGRTRQEKKGERGGTVWIQDPVAHRSYVLNAERKTARRISSISSGAMPPAPPVPGGPAADATAAARVAVTNAGTRSVEVSPGRVIVHKRVDGVGDDVHVEVIRVGADDDGAIVMPAPPMPPLAMPTLPRHKGETRALGTRSFDGVMAEGTETSYTIPAGEIGNERPIVVSSERWFSADLNVVVYAKTSDPRAGETTYRLGSLRRAEPPAELFKVPADYKLRGEGRG